MKISPLLANPQRSRQAARGFTMVELLASMAVIAVLAALLMSGMRNVQAGGRSAKCISNLRQIAIAAQTWASENGQHVLPAYMNGETSYFDPNTWTGQLAPYLSYQAQDPNKSGVPANIWPVFVCPENPLRGGYGQNYLYLGYGPTQSWGFWTAYAKVRQPSQTVFMVDSYTIGNPAKWRSFVRPPSMKAMGDSMPSFVHPGNTAHALWLDGHVTAEKDNTAFTKDDQLWDTN